MKLYFVHFHIHILTLALTLLLTYSKFTKKLKLNPTVVLLYFNRLLITLPFSGYIGYVEDAATKIIPLHYKVKYDNSLIHTVIHSYYPDLSEPKRHIHSSSLQKTNNAMLLIVTMLVK